MTPPATAAARSNRSASARPKVGQRRTAVRHPRRVSGPASSAAVALPLPGTALPRTRPARPHAPSRRAGRRATFEAPGLALRTLGGFRDLSRSALLDRLMRGRLWIGLLAFALIGIVAMQLFVLELNTGVGRSLRREAQLQRANAQLGIEDSMASAGGRVEPLAAATGMRIAAPGTLHFVAANTADIGRAAAVLAAAAQTAASASAETSAGSGEAAATSASSGESSTPATAETSEAASSASSQASQESSSASESPSTGAAGSSESSAPESSVPSTPASSAPVAQAGGGAAAPAGATAASSGGATQAGSQE